MGSSGSLEATASELCRALQVEGSRLRRFKAVGSITNWRKPAGSTGTGSGSGGLWPLEVTGRRY